MSGLRVAFIVGSVGYSGSERQLVHMCRSLRVAGADVSVWNSVRSDFFFTSLAECGVALHHYGRVPAKPIQLATLLAGIAGFRPHVVQCVQFWANAYVGIGARAVGAIGVGAQRSDIDTAFRNFGQSLGPRLLRLPHAVVVNSVRSRRQLVDRGLVVPENVYFLQNRLDLSRFAPVLRRPRETRCTFAAIGRLERGKRIDVFIRALARVRSNGAAVRGVVIGEGAERDALRRLGRDLGLTGDDLQFLGYVNDPAPILRRADVLVHCSESEGSANVVMEAMACSLPVVVTPAGDAEFLVESGVSGWLFPSGDVDALSARMRELAESDALRAAMGAAGRARAERDFSLDTLAASLFDIYRGIASRRPFRRRVRECLS